jgi:hypothetical protein
MNEQEKCPKCGADLISKVEGKEAVFYDYDCGMRQIIHKPNGEIGFNDDYASECYKSQLSALRADTVEAADWMEKEICLLGQTKEKRDALIAKLRGLGK